MAISILKNMSRASSKAPSPSHDGTTISTWGGAAPRALTIELKDAKVDVIARQGPAQDVETNSNALVAVGVDITASRGGERQEALAVCHYNLAGCAKEEDAVGAGDTKVKPRVAVLGQLGL